VNCIDELKKIGKYLAENAEGIVGSLDNIKSCDIWIRFEPDESCPSVEITKEIKC
jgi:hypothetical protein